jgi:hypothetical protein
VVVAQYADVLRHSPWATGTSTQQLVNHAYRLSSILRDDAEVVEFASLVSRASQISALGNYLFKIVPNNTSLEKVIEECVFPRKQHALCF